jgi:hypothetical protein
MSGDLSEFPIHTGEALVSALDRLASAILGTPDLLRAIEARTPLRAHHLLAAHRPASKTAEAGRERVQELIRPGDPGDGREDIRRLYRARVELDDRGAIALARQIHATMQARGLRVISGGRQ